MNIGDTGLFIRLQKKGEGYNPNHKSYRPPKDWEPGDYINPDQGTLTDGIACTNIDINRLYALDNDNFIVYTKVFKIRVYMQVSIKK